MEWLNYHHLLYFWLVARQGGLAPAPVRADPLFFRAALALTFRF